MENARPPAIFIAGTTGLDFLNSLARPVVEVVDWIDSGPGLLSWMQQAGLLTVDDIAIVKSAMSPRELDRAAAKARKLRDWLRNFVTTHMGRPLNPRAFTQLAPVNELLATDEIFWSLAPGPIPKSRKPAARNSPATFHLQERRRWRKPDSLLSAIAEEIAKFISTADFRYVKACLGDNCILFFLDQTKSHRRRWCSMAVCGNRAKQEAHANRLRKRKLSAKRRC
jgi:CGNR zinc finger/Putative stress-induced transcription regulator